MTATFSDIYLRPSALQDDSARMRAQFAASYLNAVPQEERLTVRNYLQQHSGLMPKSSKVYAPLDLHFHEGTLRDVLDSLTGIADWFLSERYHEERDAWISEVQRIFDQQHVKYAIDENGSVRLRVDANFEAERESTLSKLDASRYGGVRSEFEAAYRALSANNADGKAAVRAIFEATEIAFKLMFTSARRIGAPEIGANLVPLVERHYTGDAPAREAGKKLVQSFSDWVAAAQFYRHGQGQEEPNQPPVEIAVTILSAGAAHLRWLIHLDQAALAAQG